MSQTLRRYRFYADCSGCGSRKSTACGSDYVSLRVCGLNTFCSGKYFLLPGVGMPGAVVPAVTSTTQLRWKLRRGFILMTAFGTVSHRRRSLVPCAGSFRPSRACLALLGCVLLASVPVFTGTASANDRVSATTMQQAERNTAAPFDTRERARTRSGIGRRPLGRAPYVCTPSGFGRTASCQLRGRSSSAFN
ncbi:MAG: hypothetical protein HLUCCO17_16185 [Saliniramus fredricksonii]|uniref:Uncharacterized protein n=1 Tax=Saliniramus fredricksonii TaxID=1653334 RepID=A0A0P7X3L7_9HYPH|nr:MAG: hypothetical protein HLUCCO17_16185 [Saliniramus fredricksonii]SCC81595.1 hypothetical protein GA0071312_2547 [Saliniramus fredricksonii]